MKEGMLTTCNTGHVRAARGWVRSRGVLPRMRTRHQTRVASVSCFMTVAGHVASKFDVIHDIDLLYDKNTGIGGMGTRVASVS